MAKSPEITSSKEVRLVGQYSSLLCLDTLPSKILEFSCMFLFIFRTSGPHLQAEIT